MQSLIQKLVDQSPKYIERDEDFNPGDWSGGNFDDAYELGFRDGEAYLAQQIDHILKAHTSTDTERLTWIEDNHTLFLEWVIHEFWNGISLRGAIDLVAERYDVDD